MRRNVSLKTWVSIITFLLVALVLFLSRHELRRAWELLFTVNPWILLLLIPLQAFSYYAAGAMIFSYLKEKHGIEVKPIENAKMALELNFVNHILPSGGVSGASYMTWRLNHLGISPVRGTLAQVVRLTMTFAAYLALMLIAVVAITLDGEISRVIILVSSGLASVIVFASLTMIYIIKSPTRLSSASQFISRKVNMVGRKLFRRQKPILDRERVETFFTEMHSDYLELAKNPSVLKKPFLWGIAFNIADIAMFWVTFLALGTPINPASLLLGYGLAVIAGVFFFTPGGVGGFEALMVMFLVSTGFSQGAVIAGVLLTRVLLILGTVLSGYYFYQKALNRYGRHSPTGQ